MRYMVEIDGRTVTVDVDGDRVTVDGVTTAARLAEVPGTPVLLLAVGDAVRRLVPRRLGGRGRYALSLGGRQYTAEALDERARAIRDLTAERGPTGPAPLVAPMPGLIVRVNVAPGDSVEAGQGLVVMEAMKMENELRAAAAGRVRAVLAVPGRPVEKGAVLVELE